VASYLPQWLNDVAAVSSVIGIGVTGFLYYEARGIKNSFLRRARLPQVNKELEDASAKISSNLGNWNKGKRLVIEQFAISSGLLESLLVKLPPFEKKKTSELISKLRLKKFFFISKKLDEDTAWQLYTNLSMVITMLRQLEKDSKWD
jgi:hypothetical protein